VRSKHDPDREMAVSANSSLDMYFTCFSYNTLTQGEILAKDLRLAQNVHLSPRCTFFVQMAGCIIGALFNYIMMLT
jgi:OPT oligopeptide transporter protein